MTRRVGPVLLALSLVAFLAACQSIKDVQEAMEGKTGENEMLGAQPAKGPTLSLPPEYNLRPPVAGAGNSDPRAAAQTARQRTFAAAGVPAAAAGSPTQAKQSAGEQAFSNKVQASAGSPSTANIRQTVESETSSTGDRERILVEKLLTWQDGSQATAPANSDTVTQKAVTDISPVTIQQRRGLLDVLF
ncbi:MAG: DUF3035 domain-containing protein [Alphaproteobacteria bacterium]|nr:DUF3035 domain-containing protein [Alphaproteobacteria bacterium]